MINKQSGFRLTVRIASIILVVIAIGISAYLAYTELTKTAVACIESPVFDCGLVQSSYYSKLAGIPVAYLGLLANLGLLALLLLEERIPFLSENGVMIFFGLMVFALLFSIWLIYVQAAILHAFCPWCLAHEVVVLLLFVLAVIRLRTYLQEE